MDLGSARRHKVYLKDIQRLWQSVPRHSMQKMMLRWKPGPTNNVLLKDWRPGRQLRGQSPMAPLPADGEGPLCKGSKEPSALPEQTGLRVLWAVRMASIAVQKYTRKHKWTMRLLWDAR